MHIATKTLKSIQNVRALLKNIKKHKNVRASVKNRVLYAYSNKHVKNIQNSMALFKNLICGLTWLQICSESADANFLSFPIRIQ